MDKLTLENTRDLPMTTNTLAFLQAAYAIFEQLGNIGGDNFIVSGCTVTGSSVAPGYVFLKGKLMPFVGGTIQANVKIVTVVNQVNVDAGVREETSYRAEFGTSANPDENVPWDDILHIDSNKELMVQISDVLSQIEQLDTDITANAVAIQTNADNIQANADAIAGKATLSEIGFRLIAAASVSAAGTLTQTKGADNLTLSCERNDTGRYTITHNFGNTNYFIIANTAYLSDRLVKIGAIIPSADSFLLCTGDDDTFDNADFTFQFCEYTI